MGSPTSRGGCDIPDASDLSRNAAKSLVPLPLGSELPVCVLAYSRFDIMRELPKEDSPLESIGPSREGLSEFPFQTKSEIGFALAGGSGEKADWPKSPKGCGDAGVLQITSDFDGDTYRTVDTVKLKATNLPPARVAKEIEPGKQDLSWRHQFD